MDCHIWMKQKTKSLDKITFPHKLQMLIKIAQVAKDNRFLRNFNFKESPSMVVGGGGMWGYDFQSEKIFLPHVFTGFSFYRTLRGHFYYQ